MYSSRSFFVKFTPISWKPRAAFVFNSYVGTPEMFALKSLSWALILLASCHFCVLFDCILIPVCIIMSFLIHYLSIDVLEHLYLSCMSFSNKPQCRTLRHIPLLSSFTIHAFVHCEKNCDKSQEHAEHELLTCSSRYQRRTVLILDRQTLPPSMVM